MVRCVGFVLGLSLLVQSVWALETVDPQQWASDHQGSYLIKSVDQQIPKGENELADIFADQSEMALTFPFCPASGFCDPGYLFLAYDKTSISRDRRADGSVQDTLVSVDASGSTATYLWTESLDPSGAKEFTFQNLQYQTGGSTPRTIEFKLERQP
jgi:hypothetical protein